MKPWPFKIIVTHILSFILENKSGIDCFFRILLPNFLFFLPHLLLNMHFFLPLCLLANFQGFLSNVLGSELLILGYLNERDAYQFTFKFHETLPMNSFIFMHLCTPKPQLLLPRSISLERATMKCSSFDIK